MNNEINFLKVKSALMMKDDYVISRNPDGSFNPSDEFSNMIADSDERFRSAILTFIDESILGEWAVRFTPFTIKNYDVRIFCENEFDFVKIQNIIQERLPFENFNSFLHVGTVSDIGKLW
ncbi:MAG TPA: hypothetical protein VJA82_02215 [Sediminibacterium sp.]|uniref:hypothetical protein n=1 Tax=Sediminibacterium sp. TaxID=1917865 RepID=UPI0008B9C6A1|nr:hypothetical protein [Sediminibacterium sp.]OHC84113.1 MAG: hypothetical protein A2472_13550 [Sphingobacteriia bacterium RIFOXYC2_FULL_35_18]OHC87840.1 MAG: hypothetical protein A2546_05620 [Sphingobacteriia bacterium RIFOXYD2_FULL_35_12]HLD52095.1 hypothetical protein [Sediminibacterium sp.]